MNRLIIFHYHLLPGGVTTVIIEGIKALCQYWQDLSDIILVTGQKENSKQVVSELKSYAQRLCIKMNITVEYLPRIGYLEQENINNNRNQTENLVRILLNRFSSKTSLWWIHNYHLGKNPLFTNALLAIIKSYREQKVLLQIHDFPEAGRYQNYTRLEQLCALPLYPVCENLRYIVINSRDKDIMLKAGVPEQLVFLLDNPVPQEKHEKQPKKLTRNRIVAFLKSKSSLFNKKNHLLIYPIRAIRRKNVLEAGLIARLLGNSELLVTLPGISTQEKKYSHMVADCFNKGLIPGYIGIGKQLAQIGIDFSGLVKACDMVLCSSVQEGFGYLYINSLLWGLPLAARKLDIITGFNHIFKTYPCLFYDKINIPLKPGDKKYLKKAYLKKIRRNNILPPTWTQQLEAEINIMLNNGVIDYSFLDTELQVKILNQMKKKGFRHDLKELNSKLLAGIYALLQTEPPAPASLVESTFGYKVYTQKLKKIVNSFKEDINIKNINAQQIAFNIKKQFNQIQYIRLLYD